MKPSTTNTFKKLGEMTIPSKKVKSSPSRRDVTKTCHIIVTIYYAIVALAIIGLILTGQFPKLEKYYGKKTGGTHSRHLKQPQENQSETSTDHNLVLVEGNVETLLDKDLNVNFEIKSNPYNLSKEKIFEQLREAKVSSLKNRVKRFACWHSCFGQFRKKAFRTLYGSSLPLFPSSTKEVMENKERKRETGIETATVPKKGAENNELGEGEEKGSLETILTHDVNSKLNATDFFKLKTKVVEEKQEGKLKVNSNITSSKSTSIVDTPHPKPKENLNRNENKSISKSTKVLSKEESLPSKQGPKTVHLEVESDSEEEGGYNAEQDEEESESPEGTEDGEPSASEESTEDKGDGIDKKYLEEESGG